MFLAKSNGETLQEHTKNVKQKLLELSHRRPNAFKHQNKNHLFDTVLSASYHDLGKSNQDFQIRVQNNLHNFFPNEVPHNLLSVQLIPVKKLYRKTPLTHQEIQAICYAVGLHHIRNLDFENPKSPDKYQQAVTNLTPQINQLKSEFPQLVFPTHPKIMSARYFTALSYPKTKTKFYQDFIIVKGLLNRADYAASGHFQIESPHKLYLNHNTIPVLKSILNSDSIQYNDLQIYELEHSNDNLVIVAQTGIGKTEGALNWIGNDKAMFALPLRNASNAIYQRIHNQYRIPSENIGILDSDTKPILLNEFEGDIDTFNENVNETKTLGKQLTIGTLDQFFKFVYNYPVSELTLATLRYSKIVLDEVQMYDPRLLAYIIVGLKRIQDFGGKFQIMTATFAPYITDLLNQAGLKFKKPKPFIDKKLNHRHSVKINHQGLHAQDIQHYYHNNKVLVVVNTVAKAQQLYQELKTSHPEENIHIIHSHFIKRDRKQLENQIEAFTKSNHKNEPGIWIGTQVVEASLDIDFDILLTELSELNGLFQRMGRVYRRRNFKPTSTHLYNVIIYYGNLSDPVSGIFKQTSSVVNYNLFYLSKQAIKSLNGPITEQDKLDLIDQTYTTEKIKKTNKVPNANVIDEYYDMVNYLDSIKDDHINKHEVDQEFRNITNINVIPQVVYDQFKNQINTDLTTIDNPNENHENKLKAYIDLNNYQVNMPYHRVINHLIDNKQLNDHNYYLLSNQNWQYDPNMGLYYSPNSN